MEGSLGEGLSGCYMKNWIYGLISLESPVKQFFVT